MVGIWTLDLGIHRKREKYLHWPSGAVELKKVVKEKKKYCNKTFRETSVEKPKEKG